MPGGVAWVGNLMGGDKVRELSEFELGQALGDLKRGQDATLAELQDVAKQMHGMAQRLDDRITGIDVRVRTNESALAALNEKQRGTGGQVDRVVDAA